MLYFKITPGIRTNKSKVLYTVVRLFINRDRIKMRSYDSKIQHVPYVASSAQDQTVTCITYITRKLKKLSRP